MFLIKIYSHKKSCEVKILDWDKKKFSAIIIFGQNVINQMKILWVGGWEGGWDKIAIKDHLSPAEAETGTELGKKEKQKAKKVKSEK